MRDDLIDGPEPFPRRRETMVIGNEFAVVHLTRVETRNGCRLEISSPRLGYSISLDPLELDSLTWQTPETFARFLSMPYGPGPIADRSGPDGRDDNHQ